MKRKVFALFGIIFLVFILFIYQNETKKEETSEKMILRTAIHNDPYSLDPRITGDSSYQAIMRMLFEGLMKINRNGNITKALAHSYDISPDGKTYTFRLKESYWSNGDRVTAHDFAYAWKSILSPKFPSIFSYAFYVIKNGRNAKQGKVSIDDVGIKVFDDNTLIVELAHPTPYFLELVANPIYSPIPSELDKAGQDWHNPENYVCNGPFYLRDYQVKRAITCVKNFRYWDANEVSLDEICLNIVSDPQTTLMMYENDELDWLGEPLTNLPNEAIEELQTHDDFYYGPLTNVFFLFVNTDQSHLSSPKIRKALSLAINRETIVEHFLTNQEEPAYSILPSMLSLIEVNDSNKFSKQRALTLFHEALQELEINPKDFPEVHIQAPNLRSKVCHVIQDQLHETLGIKVVVDSYDWNTCLKKLVDRNFQLGTVSWVSWCEDPIYNLEILRFRSTDKNYTGWENIEYFSLLNAADQELNINKRNQFLRKAEQIVIEDAPIIPIYARGVAHMKKSYVKNIYLTGLGYPDFRFTVVEKHNHRIEKKELVGITQ